MTTARRHAWRPRQQHSTGFVLIALVALLVMGGLYFFISNLSPEFVQARRQQLTGEALTQARDALVGYAVRYREDQINDGQLDRVYGYLPLPDLGSSRNNNTDPKCSDAGNRLEGCDAASNTTNHTVIGRFPWRTLGTEPLRDGNGDCLWYVVSGSHDRIQRPTPMNWDTLGHLDVVIANDSASLVSALASAHDRPVAIIFSPGPPLPGQNRSPSLPAPPVGDDVSQCGGNYNPANYLDPSIASVLGGASVYFPGNSTVDTSTSSLALEIHGTIDKAGSNLHNKCPQGSTCTTVANDRGLTLTNDALFGALRKSSNFRLDINSMLDRMTGCLRDQVAAGTSLTLDPLAMTPLSVQIANTPTDKTVGRIPSNTCYDDNQNPLGYFTHYKDHFFVAACPTPSTNNCFTVIVDGAVQTCPAAILFGSQRGAKSPVPADALESTTQLRTTDAVSTANTTAKNNWPANYMEGVNLTSFTTTGALNFTGPSLFAQVSASQAASQDILRCIPAGASLSVVAPTVAAAAGSIQLANYDPGTRTLTLGSADINSNYGASAAQLFACAWTPETHSGDGGFRSYFRFRIKRVGEGFTFAVIDGDRNGADVCGASRQHLGYSGYNGITPYILPPKLAIEFDTARNCNSGYIDNNGHPACTFVEAAYTNSSTLNNGRNDPCYTGSCGGQIGYNNSHHVAVVYWGYGSALNYPTQDDNVHDQADDNSAATLSTPMPTDPSPRPAPRNPAPVLPYVSDPAVIPGIAPYDRMGNTDMSQREFHARVEVTRTFTAPTDAKDGATNVAVKFWIEPQPAKSITAMSYNAGSPPTLSVTAASHGLETGTAQNPTYVVIKDAVPSGYNGEYVITKIDTNNFIATLPAATPNPGPYISAMTWITRSSSSPPLPSQCSDNDWDCVTVNSANHGLNTGNSITISGAFPPEYNGTRTVTRIDANSYWFRLSLSYQPGPLPPAVATAKALAPRALALTNTTRPMSQLYPGTTPTTTFNPLVANTAMVYDEQTVACGAGCPSGQTCGSDNMCYRPSFRNLRLGFTLSERPTTGTGSSSARGQLIEITDRATTWLP
jgi:hypothetical protein